MARGIADERSLVNILWAKGFAVIRAPASGASTKMPRPDILAGKRSKGLQYAIEVKTTKEKTLYIQKEAIDQLLTFANLFGCTPLLAVKFKNRRRSWFFLDPNYLTSTKGKNFKLTYEEALAKGMDIKTIIGEGRQSRL
jgi:Holliday junction resolvase